MHHFPRRTFLRGVGVSMALPWLESLPVWGDSQGDASQAPLRFGVLFAGNGFHKDHWWAKGAGKEMELGKVLAQRIIPELEDPEAKLAHDSSTNELIRRYRALKG